VTAPAKLPGASLRPLLRNPDAAWNRPAFTQVERGGFPGRSVRTPRWRYTEWDEGKEGIELYDHQNDPGEMKNLAADPKQAATIAELKALVKNNWPERITGGKAEGGAKKAKKAKAG
jgi:iduronate 2-sulfatase